MSIAFSVDLEPNKDGSFDGVAEAMDWYNSIVPRGTVYATYRIATERPDILKRLAADHEVGVHVHPREFGHRDDNLAELDPARQRDLISQTRKSVAQAAGLDETVLTAFRAGRHKIEPATLNVLADLGFEVDASVNVRYRDHMPAEVTSRVVPFEHKSGLVELPTTYGEPPLLSKVGMRAGLGGNITATAHELRSDRRFCSGRRALTWLLDATPSVFSMYMHPYDATKYEELENDGEQFRTDLRILLNRTERSFVTASEIYRSIHDQ
ncbi:hypothetical protein B9H04_02420 [Halorubrum ezzemoulense DSM 17463]|uniref:NodB homology domain-containing protein n=1 Tax=Halorubrum ezzemoulense DSM 17463 TaxID=1121945 RepID=A0A1X4HAV6_HALEZ|nr:hypothetical protein [Halorubrum ezzemoulense]OSP10596.1 hypothetical protein B9H04_02420 [Halorubrum ezzemoulense DSM 17463]